MVKNKVFTQLKLFCMTDILVLRALETVFTPIYSNSRSIIVHVGLIFSVSCDSDIFAILM
jgi:hypothetical protein